ncbi:MAG: hypothetical protein EON47_18200 [Acetobacteraceae bacterium]|nr:MAG: hypothetical protein EON47_18200 [Acetobacteraceae bacterium]
MAQDPAALRQAAAPFLDWMETAALPLWGAARYPDGAFVEQLDAAGRPVPRAGRTTLAQARQIYVFAHAAVLDPVVELYDQAFVLLALAWLARAGEAGALGWAHRTLDAIERRMRLGDTPGFANASPEAPGPRQQNPHMHLLEALLALHAAGGEARFATAARAMVALFRERLFDPATGTLAEYYGPAWQRLPEPWPGRTIWPGHHCEWAWLLDQARTLLGSDAGGEARALLGFARRHGREPRHGLLRYAVTEAGEVLDPTIRLWPQTEAVKAALALRPDWAPALLRGLMALHLARRPRGLWTETFDAGLRPVAGPIPATSLYHLFVAYAEVRRALGPT